MSQPTVSDPTTTPASCAPPCVAEPAEKWFKDEVHPHGPQLKSYLRGSFPSVRDVDDVVQESFLRVWKARATQSIRSTKSFLFQIARHLAVDVIRKERSAPVEALGDLSALSVIDERPDAADALTYHEKISLLSDALAALPDRCREVVYLRKFKGLSQKEVAAQLDISVRTVESQFARGMKLCEEFLRKRGVESFRRDES